MKLNDAFYEIQEITVCSYYETMLLNYARYNSK